MRKLFFIISILATWTSLSTYAATTSVQTCTLDVLSSESTLTVERLPNRSYRAALTQNGEVTLKSKDVKVSIKSMDDLRFLGPAVALDVIQMTLTQEQIEDIKYMVVYEVNSKSNSDDGSGITLLEITLKSQAKTLKISQMGWGYGICK